MPTPQRVEIAEVLLERPQHLSADQILETLRQNGLVEVETIAQVSSRLVVNPAALKLRGEAVAELIDRMEAAVRMEAARMEAGVEKARSS